ETWPAASTDDANHSWTVVFDQAINLSTINSQNIYVSNDAEGSTRISGINVSPSDSTHALVSPPAGGWSSASKYYLIITQNVLTSEGMPLKDTVRMPFSFIQGPGREAQTIDVINDGSQITVKVNGSQLNFDQQPYISNGHTMVPFRKIAESLGATVDWDSAKKKITIIGDKVVELTINASVAKVNGAKVTLEAPAVITGGRTMVPLRFVGESLGAQVNYKSTKILLNSKNVILGDLTVDNGFDLYVSTSDTDVGALVKSGDDWQKNYHVIIPLTPGVTNYIHVKARDWGEVAGFIGEFTINNDNYSFANGSKYILTNINDWRVSKQGFGICYETPTLSPGPWGGAPSEVDSNAEWIWTNNGYNVNTTIYFSIPVISKE
ncbi:MAG: copper amine oxidase N-terminal domain-containing protein, partial [Methanobacterium sp.]